MAERYISVLSVEPYGMKHSPAEHCPAGGGDFSALGRAVWDETMPRFLDVVRRWYFSALGRAVWDETNSTALINLVKILFQCSRSSRMG